MSKIPVGILGATGTVGQRFIQLLADHPWFEVTALAASPRSVGQRYGEVCHWLLSTPIPERVEDMIVQSPEPGLDCQIIFCSLPSKVAKPIEISFAEAGYVVCSNASTHRMAPDVPLLIPEVNPTHTALIEGQRKGRGWKGLIATSANCMSIPLAVALKPLQDVFGLRKMSIVSMQAISGAGYPGVPAPDIIDNIIPYIGGEEKKVESEFRKMTGTLQGAEVVPSPCVVSAQCNRVAVRDGHTGCVAVEFERKPTIDEIKEVWESFRPPPEAVNLPSTPNKPILYLSQQDRPQPVRDRDAGKGMSVSVGRLRPCPLFDAKFVILGHNTLRGAAGGSIHNAELLVSQKFIGG